MGLIPVQCAEEIEMNTDMIHINKITEHEDGSATVEVEMLQESYRKIFEYGLQMLFVKAVEDADNTELKLHETGE